MSGPVQSCLLVWHTKETLTSPVARSDSPSDRSVDEATDEGEDKCIDTFFLATDAHTVSASGRHVSSTSVAGEKEPSVPRARRTSARNYDHAGHYQDGNGSEIVEN